MAATKVGVTEALVVDMEATEVGVTEATEVGVTEALVVDMEATEVGVMENKKHRFFQFFISLKNVEQKCAKK
jgi:hypothetical protein